MVLSWNLTVRIVSSTSEIRDQLRGQVREFPRVLEIAELDYQPS
jgi:hypothetical protein